MADFFAKLQNKKRFSQVCKIVFKIIIKNQYDLSWHEICFFIR